LRPSSIAGIDDVAVRTLSEGLRADFGAMAVPVELESPEIRD
jgi:hypothetical protein